MSIIYYGQPSHAHFKDTLDWSMTRIDLAPQFVVCLDKIAADHFGLAYNQANLFRRHDKVLKHFNRKHYHKRSLEEWLFINSEAHIGRLDEKGYSRLVSKGNPGIVLFLQGPSQEQDVLSQTKLEILAKEVNENLLLLVCK